MAEWDPILKNPFEGMEVRNARVDAEFGESLEAVNLALASVQSTVGRASLAIVSMARAEVEDGKDPSYVLRRSLISLDGRWAKANGINACNDGLGIPARIVEGAKYIAMCKVFNQFFGRSDATVKIFLLNLALQFENVCIPFDSLKASFVFESMAIAIWNVMGNEDRNVMRLAAKAIPPLPPVGHIGTIIRAMIDEQDNKAK